VEKYLVFVKMILKMWIIKNKWDCVNKNKRLFTSYSH